MKIIANLGHIDFLHRRCLTNVLNFLWSSSLGRVLTSKFPSSSIQYVHKRTSLETSEIELNAVNTFYFRPNRTSFDKSIENSKWKTRYGNGTNWEEKITSNASMKSVKSETILGNELQHFNFKNACDAKYAKTAFIYHICNTFGSSRVVFRLERPQWPIHSDFGMSRRGIVAINSSNAIHRHRFRLLCEWLFVNYGESHVHCINTNVENRSLFLLFFFFHLWRPSIFTFFEK